jgi:Xaa-Pro dipeptidase
MREEKQDMHKQRLSQLIKLAKAQKLDAVAVVPGPNQFYLTGLSFHLSERPIVAIFRVDKTPAIVMPSFEAVRLEDAPFEMDTFTYTDEEGYLPAFQRAYAELGLAGRTVGVEAFQMRVVEVRLLEQHAPGCHTVSADGVLAELRMYKDAYELAQMRRAIAITEAALKATMQQAQVGMTEKELAGILMTEMLQRGAEGCSFSPIVAAGPNAALPHATPSDRPIQADETIVIDCGNTVGGYISDITRTFVIGELEPEFVRIHEIVQAANAAGREAAGPGVTAESVDRAARAVIEETGYGEYFTHRTGHGLGLEVHEPPYIVAGNERILEKGMTFTVEPGIYLPGRGGVRVEDDVVITADGSESLTTFPRELAPLS